jgi:ATP diphosphatase
MRPIRRLLAIMQRLRDPERGCPWDRRQDFKSLIPYTIEEAYEVADAVERGDFTDLREELGDLLLQVAFHAQLAKEQGLFDFDGVANAVCDKLIRRHPHVFAGAGFATDEERMHAWALAKARERREKNACDRPDSVLDGIPVNQPALMQAEKVQRRAGQHGFDWIEIEPVFAKVEEELAELKEAYRGGGHEPIREELGDLLFVVVNLARHLDVDAETALRASIRKFIRRFQTIERQLAASGKRLADCTLAELDDLWEQAKRELSLKG